MNNEGSSKHYVISLVLLFVAIIAVVVLTITVNNMKKEKPITVAAYSEVVTTTAPSSEIQDKTKEELNVNDTPVIVTNFGALLSSIDAYGTFIGTNSTQLKYSGAVFNYSCSEAEGNTCKSGSVTMNVGTAMLPIYTFDSPEANLGNNPESVYIMVNDNYMIIVFNANTNNGNVKLYTRTGNFIGTVGGITTTMNFNGQASKAYPYVGDGLIYYVCSNGGVYQKKADLNNLSNQQLQAQVEGAYCS